MKIGSFGRCALLIAGLIGLSLASTAVFAAQGSCHANLTVNVTGFANNKGDARIAVFNSEATYNGSGYGSTRAVRKAAVHIASSSASVTFKKLPCGTYAVQVFHSPDGSGTFRVGAFGRPSQGYGFSNNPNSLMGKPSFARSAFTLDSNKDVSISLVGE